MYNRRVMSGAPRIQVLPDTVSSAIAAGEVIERPASVIKELVENALDAGATRIEIEVEDAGIARMQVRDNGLGILSEDVFLAVQRYATSKLRSPEDLFNIRTLGFRGEALSSIAAVARMELSTRSAAEATGTKIVVEGGEILEQKTIGAPPGTTINIRDLFYNVPARRKFVKSPTTERRKINQIVQRFALAHPWVAFHLAHDGRVVFEASGSGDAREVLARVYNPELAREMIQLSPAADAPIKIHGFVSPPHLNRSNRQGIIFFVNGRWIQDASLNAAVIQAYHTLLMVGRYPHSVIHIELTPENVDVNVHPAKSEIRFREPRPVFNLVQRAVRAALLGQAVPPSVSLHNQGDTIPGALSADWQLAGDVELAQDLLPLQSDWGSSEGQVPLLRPVGQVSRAYLVAEGPDGIYLIDQHAAHERILFEQYMHEVESDQLESQALLDSITIEFSADEISLLEENAQQIQALGFELEAFGGLSFRLRRIPSIFTGRDPEQAIRAVVEDFEEDESPLAAKREARLAARICKRLAIKSGQLLSLEEQRALILSLERCASPRTCPHGRPTMIHLPVASLARQFGRT